MTTTSILARAAALCAAAILLVGCTTSRTPKVWENVDLPNGGQPIDDAVWEAADERGMDEAVVADGSTILYLPAISQKEWFGVAPGHQTAVKSDYSSIGLGVTYAYLPLQFSFSKYAYERGSAEPVGVIRRRYHPFWSWVEVEGNPGPELEVDAGGIPLLWESGSEKGWAWYFDDLVRDRMVYREFDFLTTLWWIGPGRYRAKDTVELRGGEQYITEQDFVFPLLLGRAPGILLWSHYKESADHPDFSSQTRGYGPLFGYPTYYQQTRENRQSGEMTSFRTILGGLLWYDARRGPSGEATVSEAHGPLWSLFGKGKVDGQDAIYLFRIPIKTGGREAGGTEAPQE